MIIHFDSIEQMVEIVEHLVRKGLTFEVYTGTGEIKLVGGY
jgi:hypothetical protein